MKNVLISFLILLGIVPAVRAQGIPIDTNGLKTALILSGTENPFTNKFLVPPRFKELSWQGGSEAVDIAVRTVVQKKWLALSPGYITNLVYQLRAEPMPIEKKALIIYLLGELRPGGTESLEILIENIDLGCLDKGVTSMVAMRWYQFPARQALITIGEPVINPLLNHLATEPDEHRRHLMCEVLNSVAGKEMAKDRIKQRLQNFNSALRELDSIDPAPK